VVAELTGGPATTRTPVAASTDAADVTAFDGNTAVQAGLAHSTGQAAARLLPKCDCVDETNLLPSHLVQEVARETFTDTDALYRQGKKNGS
jgi:hypothetical protein